MKKQAEVIALKADGRRVACSRGGGNHQDEHGERFDLEGKDLQRGAAAGDNQPRHSRNVEKKSQKLACVENIQINVRKIVFYV